jgi:hypothetical protein
LLQNEFNEELERGNTYPQEGPLDRDAFLAYYFAADVFIGIAVSSETGDSPDSIDAARNGREWKDCVVGCYYVSA